MTVGMMRHHTEQDVLDEIDKSLSLRKTKRFHRKDENGTTFIRANFGRHFEQVSWVCSHYFLYASFSKVTRNINGPVTRKPGLEVIKLEFILRLKIKRIDWLHVDTCS